MPKKSVFQVSTELRYSLLLPQLVLVTTQTTLHSTRIRFFDFGLGFS